MNNALLSTDHIELQALFSSTETEKCKFSLPHIQNKTNEHEINETQKKKKKIWTNNTGIQCFVTMSI